VILDDHFGKYNDYLQDLKIIVGEFPCLADHVLFAFSPAFSDPVPGKIFMDKLAKFNSNAVLEF